MSSIAANTLPTPAPKRPWYKRADWGTCAFLLLTPLVAVTWVPVHIYQYGSHLSIWMFGLVYMILGLLSITGGYHRLYSHLSYEAHPVIKFLYVMFGTSAVQGSVLRWASDHRRHHRQVDSDEDPYDIGKGFFFAHIGWMLDKDHPRYNHKFEADLAADPLLAWQHKYFAPLALFMCFGVPTIFGALVGHALEGFLIAGVLRIVVSHHCTFCINSLCHMFGSQPYTAKNSARDSWILAIFTFGEGYHNYHHKFASDYRNGIRWFHIDPTKWIIRSLSFTGLTSKLKRISNVEILKARLEQETARLAQEGVAVDRLRPFREAALEAQKKLLALKSEYQRMKKTMQESSQRRVLALKAEMKAAKLELRAAHARWLASRRKLLLCPEAAL